MRSVVALTPLRSRQRGVAAVELALLLMPLVVMFFGTTELGRAVYTYNVLDKTVRDAARHLSQHTPGDATTAAEAICLAVYGTTDCTGTVVATGLTTAMVKVCDATVTSCSGYANQSTGSSTIPSPSPINLVSVTITGYAFKSLAAFVIKDMTFKPVSVTMRAQQ